MTPGKKNMMGKGEKRMKNRITISKVIITLLMITIIGIGISGCGKTQTKLPLLEFPQFGGFTPHNFEVQINADTSKLPKQATVYKVIPGKIDEKTVEKLCKIFGFDASAVKTKDKYGVVRKQNGKMLCTYNTGSYYFGETKNLHNYFPGKVVPSKEECVKIAKSFVDKYNLLPKRYKYHVAISSNTTFHPSFEKSILIDRTVSFRPVINGREIVGASLDITIGNKGEIEAVDNYLYDIAPLKGTYALKSMDEVIKELKTDSSKQWWIEPDKPGVKKIIVDKVEIKYYGDVGTPLEFKQLFVQPVYYLSGETVYKDGTRGRFGVTLQAVSNRYIKP